MLKGIGGVHKLIYSYVIRGEELFARDMAVFVYCQALSTHDNHPGVSLEEVELLLEAVGKRDIVGVHAGNEVPLGFGEPKIEGAGDFEVRFVFENMETGVDFGILLENLVGAIGRSIVDGYNLEVGVGLVSEAFQSFHEVFVGIVDRQNDGDKRILSNYVSHSDIYRLIHNYPFVKSYGENCDV
jgi:hypothetical protein